MSIKSWKKGFMKKHCPFATEVIFDFPRFAAAHCTIDSCLLVMWGHVSTWTMHLQQTQICDQLKL